MTQTAAKSIDITQSNLALAILDQMVAGRMGAKPYAYTPIVDDNGWALGVAVANERGYMPVQFEGGCWSEETEASRVADGMNAHIGLSEDDATAIVISTMGGRFYPHRTR